MKYTDRQLDLIGQSYGTVACNNGIEKSPACDKKMIEVLKEQSQGLKTDLILLKGWIKGYNFALLFK